MNPAAVKAARIQNDLVFRAWFKVKLFSTISMEDVLSSRDSEFSLMAEFDVFATGSGSKPMSSGLLAIKNNEGITPTVRVNMPRKVHADRHPHSPIITWAVTGIIASPAPLATVSTARPSGLRLINQLLIAVGKPSSSGPENIIRPGIYKI